MEVYSIWRTQEQKYIIKRGDITHQEGHRITVCFDAFYWDYLDTDIGKILFYTENEAEAAAEELNRKGRYW